MSNLEDYIIKLENILSNDEFDNLSSTFSKKQSHLFDHEEENKFIQFDIFKEYVSIVDKYIKTYIDFDFDILLEQLIKKENYESSPLQQLLKSIIDFETFKDLMVSNMETEHAIISEIGSIKHEFERMLDIHNENNKSWKIKINNKNLKVYQKSVVGYKLHMIKTVAIMPFNAKLFIKMMLEMGDRYKWDPFTKKSQYLEKYVEGDLETKSKIVYKFPMLSPRDVNIKAIARQNYPEQNMHVIVFTDIPNVEKSNKKAINCEVQQSGFVFKEIDENNTEMTYSNHINLQVSSFLANMGSARGIPLLFNTMMKAYTTQYKN